MMKNVCFLFSLFFIKQTFAARRVLVHRSDLHKYMADFVSDSHNDVRPTTDYSVAIKQTTTTNGESITRLQQLYKGIKVWGGELVEINTESPDHSEQQNQFLFDSTGGLYVRERRVRSGVYFVDLDRDIGTINTTVIDKKRAEFNFEGFLRQKGREIDRLLKRVIKRTKQIIYVNPVNHVASLAYHLDFEFPWDVSTRPQAIIDQNGRVLAEWDAVFTKSENIGTGHGGNWQTGKHRFDNDGPYGKINVTKVGLLCYFENEYVRTKHNLWQSWLVPIGSYGYFCKDHSPFIPTNGAYSPLNDAHQFGSLFFQMFKEWYGIVPLPKVPINIRTHYGWNYANAAFLPNHETVIIGDGDLHLFHPLSTLDIVAHEIAHAITDKSSNLQYYGESGGLNEAFSDMSATALIHYLHPEKVNFKIGKGTMKIGVLRCMDNPPCDGRSIDKIRQFYPRLDVHYSSGLFNKVFYLISKLLPNGVRDAYDIMFTTNYKKWTPTIDFISAAELTLQTTDELFEGLHWDKEPRPWMNSSIVLKAFGEVGIQCAKDAYWICSGV